VQLDATAPGIRPRELDRSARRDLAALLRRLRLGVSGLDLWIPTEHFLDAARAERATEAALNAIAMAGELARLAESASGAVVSLALSPEVPAPLHSVLERQADQHGVDLADHAIRDTHPEPDARIGIGIDPASLLLAGKDPAAAAAKAGRALKCVRLSDANGIGRTAVGAPGSRLDVLSLQAAISVAGYKREVVADLRGVRDQLLAASRARSAWTPSA
jgi:sugar phosphate isomerase/epimerase